MNRGQNNIHHNYENFPEVTPYDEGNDTTNVTTKTEPTSCDDQVVNVRTHSGVWNWLRENCYAPFIASFQQQLFADVVHAGINIFPLLPIGYFFNRSIQTTRPCQELTQSELKSKTMQLQNRNQNRGWKDKVFSIQGLFILSLLAAICLVGITDDNHRSPPTHTTGSSSQYSSRSYRHNGTSDSGTTNQTNSYSFSNRNANAFRPLNNKPSNMQTANPLDKARQGPKNSTKKEK